MKLTLIRKIAFLFCCTILLVHLLHAQGKLHFDSTDIIASSGKTIMLRAVLVNTSTQSSKFSLSPDAGSFQVVNTIPGQVEVHGRDSVSIPFLLYIPRKAVADVPYSIKLIARAPHMSGMLATCKVVLKEERSVYLSVSQPNIYLQPREDSIRIPVQIRNNGNMPSPIVVTLRDQFTNKVLLKSEILSKEFADTTLTFSVVLPQQSAQLASSHILVEGAHKNGQQFSTIQINVFNVASNKNFSSDVRNETALSNSLGFYTRYLGTNMQYYELAGRGLLNSGENRIGYQVDALYYPSVYQPSLVLMNTQLSFLTNKWNVALGNIYQSSEMLLNGRGVNAQLTPSAATKWDIGFINSNYNLVGQISGDAYGNGNAVYADYASKTKTGMSWKGLFIQQWDPGYNGNSTLGGGGVGFNINKQHHIEIDAYGSYKVKGLNLNDSSGNKGGAVRVAYSSGTSKWQIQSDNYLSTTSYAGVQKGAINLIERLNYTTSSLTNLWAGFNRVSNRAQYFYVNSGLYNPSYINETAELGLSHFLGKGVQASFRPYYSYQSTGNDFLESIFDYNIHSAHMNVNLNFNSMHRQNIYLNADAGWSSANQPAYRNYIAYKLLATYMLGSFSVNANVQNGPYYPGDLAYYQYTGRKYQIYSISPAFNGYIFNQKILLNAYNSLAYENSYQRWTDNISVNLTYSMKYHFDLVARYNKVEYFMNIPSINQFDIGVVKKFDTHGQGKHYNLTLHLFEDKNGNYRMDEGERLMAEQLIQIGQDIFTTDKNGTVIYKGIPAGNYHVSILQSNGVVAIDTTISVYKRTTAYIPMHQIGIISGHVQLQQQQYGYNTDGDVAGISIVATDKTGRKSEAVTDENGNFTFYLPVNYYNLQIEAASLPSEYTCQNPTLNIDLMTAPQQKASFTILVKKRKVEVKKFTSLK